MKYNIAVVLVSGGMDSCVCAAIADQDHRLALLHVNYGQRTENRELRAFHQIADHYHADHRLVVSIEHLKIIGGSALTDTTLVVPEPGKISATGSAPQDSVPITYVPFRNAHLLAIATSWAEVISASSIFIGAVEEDGSGYPDCREVFYDAFNKVIEAGTKPETRIRIQTPLIHLSKKDIVKKGRSLNAPFDLTWSCYQNSEKACGRCESCLLRMKGFVEAGLSDPITYDILQ